LVVAEPVTPRSRSTEQRVVALDRPLLAGIQVDGQVLAFAALTILALVLRLVALGDKPFHHDESQDAYFSWVLFTGGGYKYDPLLHGPLRFYLISLMYLLFGASDFTARLAPALMGTAIVALPFFFRRQLGFVASFVTSALLCLGPAYLYFSRFTREDIYIACLTLALLAATFRFLERPRPWQPALILGLLAAGFATKETTYITVFVAGAFFLVALALQLWEGRASGRRAADAPLISAVRSVGADAWLWGAASFVGVFTVLFTTFFTNPHGLQDGLVKSIQYWLAQQPVQRGNEPWYYYLVLLTAYAWPEVILGAVGLVAVFRRPTLLRLFLVWAFVLGLILYSWAGEKMPWLLLHVMLPLLFLAGIGAQALWQGRARLPGKIGLALAAVGAVYLLHSSTALAFAHPADPEEFLIFTQSSTEIPSVRDQIIAIDRRAFDVTGQNLKLDLDSWDGVDWPWAWYLRDLHSVSFVDMSADSYAPNAQALLVADPNRTKLLPQLNNYTGYRFHLRVWWVPDYDHATLKDWANWLMWRKPWNPEGSLDEWLYVRNDVPGVSIVGGSAAAAPGGQAIGSTAPATAAAPLPAPMTIAAKRVLGPGTSQPNPIDGPRQLAVLADGSVVVVDAVTSEVVKFGPDGSVVAKYTGSGDDALKNSTGLAVDDRGNIFVADTWNHRVVKLDRDLHFVSRWGAYGATNGQASGNPSEFYGPRSVAVDAKGNVYVTDTGNKRIQEFDNNGKFIAQFGGGGGAAGQLNEPVGLALTPQGSLVVADTWNRRVQVLSATGQPVAQWPVSTWQTNVHNEPYIAVAADGTVYVTDPNVTPGRILVYSAQGQPMAVWTLSGTALVDPTGIAVGPNGDLYVSDSSNHRIVVLAGR